MGKEDKDGMLLPSAEEIEKLLAEAEAKGREKGFREAQLQCHGVEPYKEGEGEKRTIPDWQQRLLEERKELLQRTIKLRKTIDNPDMVTDHWIIPQECTNEGRAHFKKL